MDTHLLTVNVEKAKGRIEKLQNKIEEFQSFIDSAKNYDPCTFEQTVIKEYANLGSIAKVLNLVNERNYTKIQDKKYTSSDITTILESKPMDELHKYVQKIYRTNKKNGHQKKRGYYWWWKEISEKKEEESIQSGQVEYKNTGTKWVNLGMSFLLIEKSQYITINDILINYPGFNIKSNKIKEPN